MDRKRNDSVGETFLWCWIQQQTNQFRFRLPAYCYVFQVELMAFDCILQQFENVLEEETDIIVQYDKPKVIIHENKQRR